MIACDSCVGGDLTVGLVRCGFTYRPSSRCFWLKSLNADMPILSDLRALEYNHSFLSVFITEAVRVGGGG
jgi:hypothetical protein